jgi:uncharacterized damage-inducible protein DinB
MSEAKASLPEPWLRGTLTETPTVGRAVLHALQLAKEDLWKWCYGLSEEELNERPGGIASVAFHLRHISRSLDRLLTYAEDGVLDEAQLALLKSESEPGAQHQATFTELEQALQRSMDRIRSLAMAELEALRRVGKKQLPTTLGGLLVHVADHTQRHAGQAITTARLVARR